MARARLKYRGNRRARLRAASTMLKRILDADQREFHAAQRQQRAPVYLVGFLGEPMGNKVTEVILHMEQRLRERESQPPPPV